MKAKEYYDNFVERVSNNMDPDYVLVDTCRQMMVESGEIAKRRHCKVNSAVIAVYKEMEQKYAAFARLVTNSGILQLREDGLRSFVEITSPDLLILMKSAGLKEK
jgi:hypothetical protein